MNHWASDLSCLLIQHVSNYSTLSNFKSLSYVIMKDRNNIWSYNNKTKVIITRRNRILETGPQGPKMSLRVKAPTLEPVDFLLKGIASLQGEPRLSQSPAGFQFSHLIRTCDDCRLETSGALGPEDSDSLPAPSVGLIYSPLCLELLPLFSVLFAKIAHLAGNLFVHWDTAHTQPQHSHIYSNRQCFFQVPFFISKRSYCHLPNRLFMLMSLVLAAICVQTEPVQFKKKKQLIIFTMKLLQ